MTKPRLVIFDCDGVLVDSEGIFNAVLTRSLDENGLQLSQTECADLYMGKVMSAVKSDAVAMGAALNDDWIETVYQEVYTELRKGTPLVDGILDFLEQLDAATIPFCVASNGRMAKMEITLGQNGLLDRFGSRVFSAYDVGIAKPDPGLFLHATKAMGTTPDHAVVVEDSVSGVRAATAAGIRCYGYAAHGQGDRLAAEGAIVFDNMRDIASRILADI